MSIRDTFLIYFSMIENSLISHRCHCPVNSFHLICLMTNSNRSSFSNSIRSIRLLVLANISTVFHYLIFWNRKILSFYSVAISFDSPTRFCLSVFSDGNDGKYQKVYRFNVTIFCFHLLHEISKHYYKQSRLSID